MSAKFDSKKQESVKPEYLVYKTNPLLMVRDEMAIMQARFFTAYLCKVDPGNPDTYKARFSLTAFCKMLDVDTSNIKKLKEDCRTIRKMGFDFIEYRRKHGEKIDPMLMDEVSLFSRFAITGSFEEGYYVEVTPTEEMKHLLENQKHYGFVSYEAQNTLVLSTKRHMRMYEFLKRSEGRGVSVDLPTLKSYLGLTVDDYPKMKDFKRDVLDKGLKEINEKTDILVSYEPQKKGRGGKIVGFHFTVRRNNKGAPEVLPSVDEEKKLILSDEDIAEFNEEEAAASEVANVLPGQRSFFDDTVEVDFEEKEEDLDPDDPIILSIEALPRELTREQVIHLRELALPRMPETVLTLHEKEIWLYHYFTEKVKFMNAQKEIRSVIGFLRGAVSGDWR